MTKIKLENKIEALTIRIEEGHSQFKKYKEETVRQEKLLLSDIYKLMLKKSLLSSICRKRYSH